MSAHSTTNPRPFTPVMMDVDRASRQITEEIGFITWCIQQYAARNLIAHAEVGRHLEKCEFGKLGLQLAQDLALVERQFFSGIISREDKSQILGVLNRIKQENYVSLVATSTGVRFTLTREARIRKREKTNGSKPIKIATYRRSFCCPC